MKHFTLFILIASIILLVTNLFMAYYNWSHGLSYLTHIVLGIAMAVTAYSSYKHYKRKK